MHTRPGPQPINQPTLTQNKRERKRTAYFGELRSKPNSTLIMGRKKELKEQTIYRNFIYPDSYR